MNRNTATLLALAVSAAFSLPAMADQDSGKTRAQVQAELQQAERTGDLRDGDTGMKLSEMNPGRYAVVQTNGKTRAEVKAELQQAERTGDIADGETGLKLNQTHPSRYSAQNSESGKTRAEVKAERSGDIVEGETGLKLNQLYPSRYSSKV
jgi:hypothetical protein